MEFEKKKSNLKNALRRYFRGEKSGFGESVFHRWFDSFDDSKGAGDSLTEDRAEKHMDNVFKAVQEEIGGKKLLRTPLPVKIEKGKRSSVLLRFAAVIIVGSLISLGVFYTSEKLTPEQELVSIIEKKNPFGQISGFHLPDGTIVWLNAGSTLHYPESFRGDEREVELYGEAYFEVAENPDKPFIVRTNSLTTRALGTSFNVKAYPEDGTEEITLVTGKVQVSDKDTRGYQIVNPDQKVRYEPAGGLQEPAETLASLAKAWTQRELVFVRENFGTIAKTFERWYDVEFLFLDEELKNEVFVYHFKDLSLSNSMLVLKELTDFEFEITDQTVIVKKAE